MTPREYLQRRNPKLTAEEAERRYAHGTNARYTLALCRCLLCRAAHADYINKIGEAKRPIWRLRKGRGHIVENRLTGRTIVCADRDHAYEIRDKMNRRDQPKGDTTLVSAARARRHLQKLRAGGVGVKSIGPACGVAPSVLSRIIYGHIKRTRRSTEAKILAVSVAGCARGCAKIDGTETWRLLDLILGSRLYTKGWIAKQLGSNTPSLQMHSRVKVRGDKAIAVRALYDRLMAEDRRFRMFVDPAGERRRIEEAEARAVEAAKAAPSPGKTRLAAFLGTMAADEFGVRMSRFRDLDRAS